jgi:hypothetical protein
MSGKFKELQQAEDERIEVAEAEKAHIQVEKQRNEEVVAAERARKAQECATRRHPSPSDQHLTSPLMCQPQQIFLLTPISSTQVGALSFQQS